MNKWDDTLRDLLSIQERVNRLFDTAMGGVETREESGSGLWSPAVDIYETGSEIIVEAELPEVKQSDMDIKVQDNTLTIEGERKLRRAVKEGYHRIERAYGKFSRSFPLSGPVDQETIKATLKDGVLRIILPKKGDALSKQIPITGQ
ncbi:MAG: Hsp20/alpha crystallin family protein [Thermodesulfovibrionales bacterium]|jgi:HSP20 family protein